MKLPKFVIAWLAAWLIALPALAGHLDGVVTLAKDDQAAVAQIRAVPTQHVLLYFGDHLN